MTTILSVLSDKVDHKLLNKANTNIIKKRLYKKITNEIFYILLKEKRVDLAPGFGSFVLKQIKEKNKKVYDRIKKEMVTKHVRGNKIVYKPGDIIKEFL